MAKPSPPQATFYNPPSKEVPVSSPLATVSRLGDLRPTPEAQDALSKEDPRFSQKLTPEDRSALYQKDLTARTEKAVFSPPAPFEFQAIQVGPETSVAYEPTLVSQVEMSSPLLRKLSPFMIQVEPPLAFGEDGGLLSSRTVSINAFGTALRGLTGYESARSALAQSTLAVGVNAKVGTVQEFVAVNARSGPKKETPSQRTPSTKLGEPAIADLMAAADVAWQLSAIMQAPPLVLLINPQSMQMAYTKVQQFQDKSRYGFLFQAWGEEQPKLSLTARCGAFVSGGRGVQYVSKRDSLSWQNLMNAFHLYKSNGYLYDTIGRSNAHHFVGALSIHYDQWIYYGHMESFNWTYEESNQLGGIEFNIEFTVSAMVDTAQQTFVVGPMRSPIPSPSDPRYVGLENRSRNLPGEFSLGFSSDGTPRVTSQGRVVTGESFGLLVPGGLEPLLNQAIGFTKPSGGDVRGQPIGNRGFQSVVNTDTLGHRQVAVSQRTGPFGLR